jgi:hypothetical protein
MLTNIIVYNPGYAGNFLIRLFSLGTDIVPQMPINMIQVSIPYYSIDQRLSLYSFSKVREQHLNWQKFHREWMDFQKYENINDLLVDCNYTHIVFAMHAPELELYSSRIQTIQDVKYFYVDLDLEKYGNWIKSAQRDLNFKYRIDEIFKYNLLLENAHPDYKIDLTAMLNSEDDFLKEYHRVCSIMQIIPIDEAALLLYRDWYATRVACYLD